YWNVPYQRNHYFTGRSDLLEQLHARLRQERTVALTQSLALSGLGGIGKTQTAVEYAYQHIQEYSALFWISAETAESILGSFASLADRLNLPEKDEPDQH